MGAAAGVTGDELADRAARAAFGGGQGLSALLQEATDDQGQIVLAVAEDQVTERVLHALPVGLNLFPQFLLILSPRAQPQTYGTEIGQVGQRHIFGQAVLEGLQPLGDVGLPGAGREYGHGAQAVGVEVLILHPPHHLVLHQVGHLVGDAGHGDEYGLVLFQPQPGGGAPFVGQHLGPGGQAALLAVSGAGGAAVALVELLQPFEGRGVEAQLAAEVVGQHLFGDIVLGGAQAAGHQHEVRLLQGAVEAGHDALPAVGNGKVLQNRDPLLTEGGGQVGGVGIDNLPDENLVADGKNSGLHSRFMAAKVHRPSGPGHFLWKK